MRPQEPRLRLALQHLQPQPIGEHQHQVLRRAQLACQLARRGRQLQPLGTGDRGAGPREVDQVGYVRRRPQQRARIEGREQLVDIAHRTLLH